MSTAYVVTTIHAPTVSLRELALAVEAAGETLVVVGDLKSPSDWECHGVTYLSVAAQQASSFATSMALPFNTYARKLVGYLHAAACGARWIRETDDDNRPYEEFVAPAPSRLAVRSPMTAEKFLNIYSFFTDLPIWPRGLPLTHVRTGTRVPTSLGEESGLMVLQALADGDPDVDAVYRMTTPNQGAIRFESEVPLAMPHGTWAPFNSQATTWPRELLPLMYLPSTCSFRMTDIWRSYIAQRLMPGLGASLVITRPMVYQDRNEHDLMRDFRDEIEGYVGYERFVETLEHAPITGGFNALFGDLRGLYVALINAEFFTSDELPILDAWIADMESLGFGPTT